MTFNRTYAVTLLSYGVYDPRGMAFRCWWWRSKFYHGTAELKRCFQCGKIIGKVETDFCFNCKDYDEED